jgi:hypothetical protein
MAGGAGSVNRVDAIVIEGGAFVMNVTDGGAAIGAGLGFHEGVSEVVNTIDIWGTATIEATVRTGAIIGAGEADGGNSLAGSVAVRGARVHGFIRFGAAGIGSGCATGGLSKVAMISIDGEGTYVLQPVLGASGTGIGAGHANSGSSHAEASSFPGEPSGFS